MAEITIKWGDTLGALAQRYGTTVQELAQTNAIANPDLIFAGAKLIVPGDNNQAAGDNNQTPGDNNQTAGNSQRGTSQLALGDSPADPAVPAQPNANAISPTGKVPSDSLQGQHGGQCVVFVENQTGTYFPVDLASQMLNPGKHPGYGIVSTPQAGDIFVSTHGAAGHTGFVKAVNADGSITVVDSNSNLDEVVHVHTYPASYASGYLRRDPAQAATSYGRG